MKILDYKCKDAPFVGVDIHMIAKYGFKFPEAYMYEKYMTVLSQEFRQRNQDLFCVLPFCHTVEAEAMGADIVLGDEVIGPRAGKYRCNSIKDLLELKDIDFSNGRIHEVLKSIKVLKQAGEKVMLEVSGPFTILNCLIDPIIIYKAITKNDDSLLLVLDKLKKNIMMYMKLAIENDVDVISYADSSASLEILGPRLAKKVMELFTFDFLREVESEFNTDVNGNIVIHLCPKTTQQLLGMELATFKDFDVDKSLTYEEAIYYFKKSTKESIFLGQMCINSKKQLMKTGKIKYIKLCTK